MIPGLTPEETVKSQLYIGITLCDTFKEITNLADDDVIKMMELLYEKTPYTSKQISDDMFDSYRGRRVNTITSMTISKKYIPLLRQSEIIESTKGVMGTMYQLNGYKKMWRESNRLHITAGQ